MFFKYIYMYIYIYIYPLATSRPDLSGNSQGTCGMSWPHATCLLRCWRCTARDPPSPFIHSRVGIHVAACSVSLTLEMQFRVLPAL